MRPPCVLARRIGGALRAPCKTTEPRRLELGALRGSIASELSLALLYSPSSQMCSTGKPKQPKSSQ